MTTDIATYLKFANVQIAAEALYQFNSKLASGGAAPGTTATYPTIDPKYLTDGNEHSSKFTATQAADFAANWVVVEHKSNTATGFSGTLFKYIGATDAAKGVTNGELVMSFRSTEFIDDSVRDNQATNTLEVKAFGWAFGQIADMEAWYQSLKSSGKIGATDHFSVTGYSLGGHLATAFNLMRDREWSGGAPVANPISGTYTFNGAGVGDINDGAPLKTLIADFDRMRKNVSGTEINFTDPDAQREFLSLRGRFAMGSTFSAADASAEASRIEHLRTRVNPADAPIGIYWPTQRNKELGQLQLALERITSIQAEALRVPTVPSGGGTTALSIQGSTNIEALRLDYQVAVLFAASHTSGYRTDVLSGAIDSIGSRNTRGPLAGFYDLYGSNFEADNFSAVANSQWHYGASTPLWIEDQPVYRGRIFAEAGSATLKAGEVKLLVDNFNQNDFGDTHSLVLLVDSLRVQNALTQLDPALKEGTLAMLLKAAANNKASSTSGTQGKADGDTLEQVANDLAKLLGVAGATLKGSLEGNTWALVPGPSGFTGRDALQTLLNNIDLKIKADGLSGKFTVATTHDAKLAQSDFAALLSLTLGATFSLHAKSEGDKALINAKLGANYPTELAQFNADLGNRASGNTVALNYTDHYLSDRCAALNWLITADTKNLATDSTGVIPVYSQYGEKIQYLDLATDQTIAVGNPYEVSPAMRYVKFGDNRDNTLIGDSLADHLYGGAGIDTLKGYAGKDYLEGGAGADTLLGGLDDDVLNGGKDFDSYQIDSDGGRDTIQDSDGLGKVTLAGIVLVGGKHVAGTQAVWESVDGKVQYQKLYMPASNSYDLLVSVQGSSASARIENWQPAKGLGITLADEAAPALTLKNIEQYTAGVFDSVTGSNLSDKIDTGKNTDFVYSGNGDDVVALMDGNDVANGGAGCDLIDGGADNDYLIGGATSGTPEQASLERDTLIGGLGCDLIKGGLGDDILIGSERNAPITGADQSTQGDWLLGGEGDDIASGSLGRDFINGGAGADSLDGGDTVNGDDLAPMEARKQGTLTQSCWRTRRASVPQRLRARGLGVVCTPAVLHQHRGLHANSAATANWLRRCGTATRHVCGFGWSGAEQYQSQNVHSMRLAGLKEPEKRMDAMKVERFGVSV